MIAPSLVLFSLVVPALMLAAMCIVVLSIASPFLLYEWVKKKASNLFGVATLLSIGVAISWAYVLILMSPYLLFLFNYVIGGIFSANVTLIWMLVAAIAIPPWLSIPIVKIFPKLRAKYTVLKWFERARMYIFGCFVIMLLILISPTDGCDYELIANGMFVPNNPACW